MSDDDQVTLICARVRPGRELVTPGSVMRNCAECDHPLWVAPSGQDTIAGREHTLICMACYRPPEDGSKPEPISARQIEEFKAALRMRGKHRRGRFW